MEDSGFQESQLLAIPKKPKKRLKRFIFGAGIVLLALFMLTRIGPINQFSSLFKNAPTNRVISHTKAIKAALSNEADVTAIIGLGKHVSGDIVKTKDGRFWFFRAAKDGCVEFCSFWSYMIDTEHKTISDLYVDAPDFNIKPLDGSVVALLDASGSSDENSAIRLYDAANDTVIDTIPSASSITDMTLAPDGTHLFYLLSGHIYSRNLMTHTTTEVARLYQPDESETIVFDENKSAAYMLAFVGVVPVNKPGEYPSQDEPVQLIRFDLQKGTVEPLTKQQFNFPFYLTYLAGAHAVLVGGGRNSGGVITFPTYIVDTVTGAVKQIYNAPTNGIQVDTQAKQISIFGNQKTSEYWAPNIGHSDTVTVFDFNGALVSKKYYQDGQEVSAGQVPPADPIPTKPTQYPHYEQLIKEYKVLKPGQTFTVENIGITLRDVAEDSRCVLYAKTCIRNFFKINADIVNHNFNNQKSTTVFTFGGNGEGVDNSFGNKRVYISKVEPTRTTDAPLPEDQYILTFTIEHYE